MLKKVLLCTILLITLSTTITAEDFNHIISNSENWKDVYSAMHYANLKGAESDFLTSTAHGTILLNGLKKDKIIRVITSKKNPYMFNYADLIESKGFAGVDEIEVNDANLELIEELPDINNFIIVGDSYGYNAIAAIPYAKSTNSWVFLANKLNIQEIDSILSRRNINKILIYGYVDKEITDTLNKYTPETINKGDRFEDNIEIVKKELLLNPSKQVLLTNGEFIEKELMGGKQPILFTGKNNVPDQIRDYLKNSEIEIGVLIGNELIGTATNIRENTGISVMVKFARGARSQSNGVAAVEGLDLFPVPTPSMKLGINSIEYNKLKSQIEITYKSDSNIPIYLKGTLTIDGKEIDKTKVGDTDAIFMAPGTFKTIVYPLNLNSMEELEAEIYVLYGETSSALEQILQETKNIEVTEVLDRCQIEITKVNYNKQKATFNINIKNTAEVPCWVNTEIEGLLIGYTETTIGAEKAIKISPGKTETISIDEDMTEEDLEKNSLVNIIAYYGEKEEGLANILKSKLELSIKTLTLLTYSLIAIFILIILIGIALLILKDRDDF